MVITQLLLLRMPRVLQRVSEASLDISSILATHDRPQTRQQKAARLHTRVERAGARSSWTLHAIIGKEKQFWIHLVFSLRKEALVHAT